MTAPRPAGRPLPPDTSRSATNGQAPRVKAALNPSWAVGDILTVPLKSLAATILTVMLVTAVVMLGAFIVGVLARILVECFLLGWTYVPAAPR